ncbi:FAD/NAD(P)-binding domain-containing protein [Annulohypoxylon maeteangense]|uniref:FAD/NAD(P)-binding domain-containing protein n=1 Tax=Annulohypoxylon maeteangense TaxID=1927788 RepID=UPI0020073155|nr:FAD/NAD(P)-binding domain-containing protein [Annulohypoxylon maeteangense]KAI0888101.1 FAD/NAD(P)-binding domain-containing protein [Annulohypoxylon maeteangense]
MATLKIAIIGGGPAGLTLAKLLQKANIGCKVFERDAYRHAKNRGGSLDLHPESGQRALKEAGLLDEFKKLSRPEGETLRIYSPDGNVLMDESRGEPGRPGEFANRPEIDRTQLRDLLLDSLAPDTIDWNSRLLKIRAQGDSKLALLFTNGNEEGDFDLVVGADGAWSKVRSSVSETEPLYSGISGLDCRISDVDARFEELSAHVGQGMCLNLGSDKGLLCQRNGDGSVQLYAFARLPNEWFSTCGIDFTHPRARQEVVDALFPEYTALQKSLVLNSDPDTVGRQLYMLPVGFQWTHNPRITLIGDAAHLMNPFAGVGVNVAMEDALELAHAIIGEKVEEEQLSSLSVRLQKFEVGMWKRAKQNAEATVMYQNLFFHKRGGVAMVEHFAKRRQEDEQQN